MIRALSLLLTINLWAASAEAGTCTALLDFVTGDEAAKGATCSTSKVLGGATSKHCYWTFAFRSDAAREWFAEHAELLRQCADGPVSVEGATVNHPDSFDQMTAKVEDRDVSLSLKDKGALSQTLVFLRVARP